jgi:hypothetical protein
LVRIRFVRLFVRLFVRSFVRLFNFSKPRLQNFKSNLPAKQ